MCDMTGEELGMTASPIGPSEKTREIIVAGIILLCVLAIVFLARYSHATKPPEFTAQEKVELLLAQRDMETSADQAKSSIAAYQGAQAKLNTLIEKDLRAHGLEPAKYDVLQDLSIKEKAKETKK